MAQRLDLVEKEHVELGQFRLKRPIGDRMQLSRQCADYGAEEHGHVEVAQVLLRVQEERAGSSEERQEAFVRGQCAVER